MKTLQWLLETVDLIKFENFNMATFINHRGGHSLPEAVDLMDCNTTACLAGWASAHPELGRRIYFEAIMDGDEVYEYNLLVDGKPVDGNRFIPLFKISDFAAKLLFYTLIPIVVRDKTADILRSRIRAVMAYPDMTEEMAREWSDETLSNLGVYSWRDVGRA